MSNHEHALVSRAQPENVPPGQAFRRCESHDIPMLYDGEEWVCAIESLMDCLGESELVGFEFQRLPDSDDELTLSFVFADGHIVPLLCPDCGNTVEDEDDEIEAIRAQIASLPHRFISDIHIGTYDEAIYPWLGTLLILEVGGSLIEVEIPFLSLYYMTHPADLDEPPDELDWDALN